MKALVAGGAGFLGSTLAERLLAEGHAVDVVDDLSTGALAHLADARADRSNHLTFHRLDLADPTLGGVLARRAPDVVFHLALPPASAASTDPVGDADATVVRSLRLLEAVRAAGAAKVVVVLDAAAYHGRVGPDELPVLEASPAEARRGPHGVASRALVEYLAAARAQHDLEFTAVALATTYGPRQPATSVPGALVGAALAGVSVAPPAGTTDLVYVDDAVDAVVRAAARGGGLVVNVGSGEETPWARLAELVGRAVAPRAADDAPAPASLAWPDDPHRPDRFRLDVGRAGIHLGWAPWTTLEAGVSATVAAAVPGRQGRGGAPT